jgi:hypothetical protein
MLLYEKSLDVINFMCRYLGSHWLAYVKDVAECLFEMLTDIVNSAKRTV